MVNNIFLKERIRFFSDLLKKVDLKLFEHLMVNFAANYILFLKKKRNNKLTLSIFA